MRFRASSSGLSSGGSLLGALTWGFVAGGAVDVYRAVAISLAKRAAAEIPVIDARIPE